MCDVLLLEDDDLIREVMVDVLRGEGLDVRAAEGVATAEAVLRDPPGCRVLVADHDLADEADLDGFAFALQAMRVVPGLRVIYMTGRPHLLDDRALTPRERALPKPFPSAELLRLIRELMGTDR